MERGYGSANGDWDGRSVMTELVMISPAEVAQKWDAIRGWVESSLGIDKSYVADDVRKACESGQIQLWIINNNNKPAGFLTTAITENPQGNTCYCPWLGGENLSEWVPEGFEQLKQYLRQQNCLSLSWMGREAWQRLIKVDSRQCFYSIHL